MIESGGTEKNNVAVLFRLLSPSGLFHRLTNFDGVSVILSGPTILFFQENAGSILVDSASYSLVCASLNLHLI